MFQVTGAPTTRAGPPGKTSTSLRRCSLKQLFMEPSAGLLITAVMHSENNTETDSVAHCAASSKQQLDLARSPRVDVLCTSALAKTDIQ